jgi:hypothetical protein
VAGEIPGFPDDDSQTDLAQRHVLRSADIEAAARARPDVPPDHTSKRRALSLR